MVSKPIFQKSLFVFRRDFRLNDNTGLINALENSKTVIPIFIYDDYFARKFKDSKLRWNFLNESLLDLNEQLTKVKSRLQVFKGVPKTVIKKIIENFGVESIFLNTDFTNYSKTRDEEIYQICKDFGIDFSSHLDFLLHNPNDIKTNTNNPYTIYSQFFKKARQFPVRKSNKISKKNFYKNNISDCQIVASEGVSELHGGRCYALKILKDLRNFKNYSKLRDFPAEAYTTKLSAYSKFGNISIREIYETIKNFLGPTHTLIQEIYWREFFNYVCFHFPWAYNKSFKEKFRKIQWSQSKRKFQAWCKGQTGFPIVDAGMRELNQTGLMHNRVRMVVASFLTKDLHLDWRLGAGFFAQKLIDYDPAVNSGNWQWAASTGCDSVPYFRIFNPWLQQEKFDKDCVYIKKWVQELDSIPSKIIHNLWNFFPDGLNYPKPIVNHKLESKKAITLYQNS